MLKAARLHSCKSVQPFKEIICDDVSEFESSMPSHAVRSLCAMSAVHLTRSHHSCARAQYCSVLVITSPARLIIDEHNGRQSIP
jgi:hypothetical protein